MAIQDTFRDTIIVSIIIFFRRVLEGHNLTPPLTLAHVHSQYLIRCIDGALWKSD